jgi:FlaA1/EpsC-like NDP-sugar epimerase
VKPRYDFYSTTNQYLIDTGIIGFSFLLAYQIRFEGRVPAAGAFQMWLLLPAIIVFRLAVNTLFGVYRQVWRYAGIPDALQNARAYGIVSLVLVIARLTAGWWLVRLPLSVITLEFLMSLYGALTVRLLRRVLYQRQLSHRYHGLARKRVLLVGAQSAGVIVAKELSYRPDVDLVGFLDDDPRKKGMLVNGLPVLGPTGQLAETVRQRGVDEIVLCIQEAPAAELKRLWRLCESTPVRSLIVPSLGQILDREVGLMRLQELRMEELLGRERPALEAAPEIAATYRHKRILVSGAAGSIGSELVRQLAALEPACLLLFDKDENGLYDRQLELQARSQRVPFEILVGDMRFRYRMERIFARQRPEIVFHAAAHKHVPLMELNPCEAILNNVFGTDLLSELAAAFGTERFVLISTDKAVNPTNIMGASKRLAELVVQSWNGAHATRFCSVRFGNVMASRGSVIPIFQKQIAAGGPVTLTDPDMRRFFMTIPEAVDLVLQAGVLAEAGFTYVLNMGDQIRIADLARDLIELSGLRPGHDIRLEYVGVRPGEKLFEELVAEDERLSETLVPEIGAVVADRRLDTGQFREQLALLRQAAEQDDLAQVHDLLYRFQIGFRPPTQRAAAVGAAPS